MYPDLRHVPNAPRISIFRDVTTHNHTFTASNDEEEHPESFNETTELCGKVVL
jgi:hypothetical protein